MTRGTGFWRTAATAGVLCGAIAIATNGAGSAAIRTLATVVGICLQIRGTFVVPELAVVIVAVTAGIVCRSTRPKTAANTAEGITALRTFDLAGVTPNRRARIGRTKRRLTHTAGGREAGTIVHGCPVYGALS